jgi:hypothetical protein
MLFENQQCPTAMPSADPKKWAMAARATNFDGVGAGPRLAQRPHRRSLTRGFHVPKMNQSGNQAFLNDW